MEKGVKITELVGENLQGEIRYEFQEPVSGKEALEALSKANIKIHGLRLFNLDCRVANLEGLYLQGAIIENCNFDGANLEGVNMSHANVQDSSFNMSLMGTMDAFGTGWRKCSFVGIKKLPEAIVKSLECLTGWSDHISQEDWDDYDGMVGFCRFL